MPSNLLVFVVLGVGMIVLALLVGIRLGRRSAAPAPTGVAGPPPVEPSPAGGEATPEVVAVLAAAANATLGRPVVLRRISVLRSAGQENWSRVGRIDILRSHRMDPKR